MKELRIYDTQADAIGLKAAYEIGSDAVAQKLLGLQKNQDSAANEQLFPKDAYWQTEYGVGVDGHGNPALVHEEIAIPGRIHRENSSAMIDSMCLNAAYTLEKTMQGDLPHEAWDAANEQFRQFKAVQKQVLGLSENESFLTFALNGSKTEDGIALQKFTRNADTFLAESILIGGISEDVAREILQTFHIDTNEVVQMKPATKNPLYMGIKGKVEVDINKKKKINVIVEDVLTRHNETRIQTVTTGSCRTEAVLSEKRDNKIIRINSEKAFPTGKKDYFYINKIQNKEDAKLHTQTEETSSVSMQTESTISELGSAKNYPSSREYSVHHVHVEKTPSYNSMVISHGIVPESQILFDEKNYLQEHPERKNTQKFQEIQQEENGSQLADEKYIPVPIATFLYASDKNEMTTQEYAIAATFAPTEKNMPVHLHRQRQIQTVHQIRKQDKIVNRVPTLTKDYPVLREEYDHTLTQTEEQDIVAATSSLYEVKNIAIEEMHTVLQKWGSHISHAEHPVLGVSKLVWMMRENNEWVPVEQLEIAQDPSTTIQHLLHFLRKIIRTYAGDDSIRERVVLRMRSDMWKQSEESMIDEIEEYLAMIGQQYTRGHLYATIN